MKLGDIYKHKENNNIIQIDSFACHMSNNLNILGQGKSMIIVYTNIDKHSDEIIGSCPSFNGYGTQSEIEKEYELLVSKDDLNKYSTWEEIFELVK